MYTLLNVHVHVLADSFSSLLASSSGSAHSGLEWNINPGDPDAEVEVNKHGSELLLQIYALTKGSITKVIQDMEELWKHESTREILDSKEDQKNIGLLRDDQVRIHAFCYIFVCHPSR